MSKVRAIVLFTIVIGVAFGTAAAADTPFLQTAATTDQVALLVPFLAFSEANLDSAISISNTLGAPNGILPTTGLSTKQGTIEAYFFMADGTAVAAETIDNSLGNGVLTASGELKAGRTFTVLLSQILAANNLLPPAGTVVSGYAWVVCNFDAAQGTVTVFYPDYGFAQSLNMEPTITPGNLQGGIPVVVP